MHAHTVPHLAIRPVSARDRARLSDLLARMSPGAHASLPRVDGRVTLAAVDPRDGSFAGIAQYAPAGDGSSDVAFVVTDEWQRRGVGTLLALALLKRAAANRRRRLVALARGVVAARSA